MNSFLSPGINYCTKVLRYKFLQTEFVVLSEIFLMDSLLFIPIFHSLYFVKVVLSNCFLEKNTGKISYSVSLHVGHKDAYSQNHSLQAVVFLLFFPFLFILQLMINI